MESRTHSTITSRALDMPFGVADPERRWRRTEVVATTKTTSAAIHSIRTCLVTSMLMPKSGGRWISGCSPLATCPTKSICSGTASSPLHTITEQPNHQHGLRSIEHEEPRHKTQSERSCRQARDPDSGRHIRREKHNLREEGHQRDRHHTDRVAPI